MKKLTAIALILMLALSLVACGGSNDTASDSGKPVLRVAMECAYAPYNWAQASDANGAVPIVDSVDYAYGYDVMMAKYLADYMGYDLEIYQIEWDALPMALQAGTVDCVIAGQSITAERLQTVDFTDPYYYASIYAVTLADSAYANATTVAELEGATCTSQINTIWYTDCIPQIPNANILPAIESAPAMFVALESGKCDLVVTDEPAALGALAVYSDMVMLDLTAGDFQVSDEIVNIGISVKKGNSDLLNKLNEGLATLTREDFVSMMNEAIELSANL